MLCLIQTIWLLAVFLDLVQGVLQNYCSPNNLGLSSTNTVQHFQSDGLCSDNCKSSGYTFAIVQGYDCWCSNVLPTSDQLISVDNCNDFCPGYSPESCGNVGKGYFGYIYLGTGPLTVSVSTSSSNVFSTSSAISSVASSSSVRSSNLGTIILSSSSSLISSLISSSSKASSSSSTTCTTSSTTSLSTANSSVSRLVITSVVLSVMTLTSITASSNRVTTIEVTTIYSRSAAVDTGPSVSLANYRQEKSNNSYWDSPGKVAGTFVPIGMVLLTAIIIIYWLFIWRPRKQQRDFEKGYNNAVLPADSHLRRSDSFSSQTGEKFVYVKNTGFIDTPNNYSVILEGSDSASSKTSQLVVDQRLDSGRVMTTTEFESSDISLADYVDYSRRVLHVANN